VTEDLDQPGYIRRGMIRGVCQESTGRPCPWSWPGRGDRYLRAYRDPSRRRRPVPRLHRLWGDQDRRCICVLADPAPNRSARVLVHAGVPTPPPGCEVPTMPRAGCFANGTMATIPSPGGRPDRILSYKLAYNSGFARFR